VVWTSHLRRVIAYIDGFNLYNGLRERYERRYLWLDLEGLCRRLILPDQELVAVKYFTAAVRNRPDSLRRQQKFWNALDAHCPLVAVEPGRFQHKTITCRSCSNTWTSYEEKETDVAIAVALVEDAVVGAFDTALLVSADSDLCPAVRAARRLNPSAVIVAAFPPARWSDGLRDAVHTSFTIARMKLADSLMPDPVVTPEGKHYPRPYRWR
jgi:uncharacterized LabA/DUF88 family protein